MTSKGACGVCVCGWGDDARAWTVSAVGLKKKGQVGPAAGALCRRARGLVSSCAWASPATPDCLCVCGVVAWPLGHAIYHHPSCPSTGWRGVSIQGGQRQRAQGHTRPCPGGRPPCPVGKPHVSSTQCSRRGQLCMPKARTGDGKRKRKKCVALPVARGGSLSWLGRERRRAAMMHDGAPPQPHTTRRGGGWLRCAGRSPPPTSLHTTSVHPTRLPSKPPAPPSN